MPSQQPRYRDAHAAVRAGKAMQLRLLGYDFTAIAHECGYADRGSAYNAVKRELARTVQQPADDLRVVEAERLDALMRPMMARALKGDHGAVDRCLRIMERRARLLGLDVQPKGDPGEPNVTIIEQWPAAFAALREYAEHRAGTSAPAADAPDESEPTA